MKNKLINFSPLPPYHFFQNLFRKFEFVWYCLKLIFWESNIISRKSADLLVKNFQKLKKKLINFSPLHPYHFFKNLFRKFEFVWFGLKLIFWESNIISRKSADILVKNFQKLKKKFIHFSPLPPYHFFKNLFKKLNLSNSVGN